MIRTYSELSSLQSFEDRYEYLRLRGTIGVDTFGFDRVFNQMFYASKEWKRIREQIIIRDNACDLGVDGYDIPDRILIHHMNPIELSDIQNCTVFLLNPEYLITVSHATHNAIHYGTSKSVRSVPVERTRNDTCPWKR